MSPDKYCQLLKRYIDKNFDSYAQAAKFFRCSPATITLVLQNERSPNLNMLAITGHERVEGKASYVKVKL